MIDSILEPYDIYDDEVEEEIVEPSVLPYDKMRNILRYIERNFEDGPASTQYRNYLELIKYLNTRNIVISMLDADVLLNKSEKLTNMIKGMKDDADFKNHLTNPVLDAIYSAYAADKEYDNGSFDYEDYEDRTEVYEKTADSVFKSYKAGKANGGSMDLTQQYLSELNHSILSPEQEKELYERIKNGDEEAAKELADHNLRLVVSVAKRYIGRGLDFQDLIGNGNLGLLKAVEKFDANKGYKFSTYATWWIRQAITRGIPDQSANIRIPVHTYEMLNKMRRIEKTYLETYGEEPDDLYLAAKLEVPVDKIIELKKTPGTISLNTPVGDEDDSTIQDFVEDPFNGTDAFNKKLFLEEFRKAVFDEGILKDREAEVLKYRFGFYGGRCYTLEEVGKIMGVTRERIRQIESRAIRVLRRKVKQYNPKYEDTYSGLYAKDIKREDIKMEYCYKYKSPYKDMGGRAKVLEMKK